MRRIIPWIAAASAVAVFAAGATADLWWQAPSEGAPVDVPARHVEPSSITVACPSGMVDPYAFTEIDPAWTEWDSAGSRRSEIGGGIALERASTSDGRSLGPAVTIAAQGTGEFRGIAATSCQAAATTSYVSWGSTAVGEDLVLELANPGPSAVGVTVTAIGASAPVVENPTVRVPAKSVVRVLPASWYPGEERPILRIDADGGGIAAWAQTSGLDGDAPTGADAAAATVAGTTHVLAGIPAKSSTTLVVVNPAEEPTKIDVTAMTSKGSKALGAMTDVEVAGGTTLAVDLADLPEGTAGLTVHSPTPVIASAESRTTGSAYAGSKKWTGRTVLTPITTGTQTTVPAGPALVNEINPLLKAAPLRKAAAGDGPSGARTASIGLVVANPGGDAAKVSVGTEEITVAPGAAMRVDAPAADAPVTSDQPVAIALVVSAALPTGAVTSVTGLERIGSNAATTRIDLAP